VTPDFFDLTYLSKGSAIQRKGFHAISSLRIMEILNDFTPAVAGTLPLDLFTDKSDIDIICCYEDGEDYIDKILGDLDKVLDNFYISHKDLGGIESKITNFEYEGFKFEIVGQKVPVTRQVAYRHMIREWEILSVNDAAFKEKILELKRSGLKTEPAFAKALGLQGDPYEALLQ
jgi:hypothetical protein